MGKLSPIFQSEGQEAQSLLDVLQVMRPESDGGRPAARCRHHQPGGGSQLQGADPHDCEAGGAAAAGRPHALRDSLQRNTFVAWAPAVRADAEHSS